MPENKKLRLFIAIELPLRIQQVLEEIQSILKEIETDIKWTKADNIHLTLKFLGYVENSQIKAIKDKMNLAVEGFRPFDITLAKNVGVFPRISYPRVIWVGIDKGENEVINLQKKLEDEINELGFEKEKREFTPHLTLGRVKSLKSKKEDLIQAIQSIHTNEEHKLNVSKLTLFKSILRRTGPIYEVLHETHFII